jgi:hypothetical protein
MELPGLHRNSCGVFLRGECTGSLGRGIQVPCGTLLGVGVYMFPVLCSWGGTGSLWDAPGGVYKFPEFVTCLCVTSYSQDLWLQLPGLHILVLGFCSTEDCPQLLPNLFLLTLALNRPTSPIPHPASKQVASSSCEDFLLIVRTGNQNQHKVKWPKPWPVFIPAQPTVVGFLNSLALYYDFLSGFSAFYRQLDLVVTSPFGLLTLTFLPLFPHHCLVIVPIRSQTRCCQNKSHKPVWGVSSARNTICLSICQNSTWPSRPTSQSLLWQHEVVRHPSSWRESS